MKPFELAAALLATAAFAGASTYATPALAQPPPPVPTPASPMAPMPTPMSPPTAMAPPMAPVIAGVPAGYMPPSLEWNKGDPVPAGYTPSTEVRTGFVIAGSVTLGVSWVFGGVIPGIAGLSACGDSSGGCSAGFGLLLVPAVGPFAAIGPLAAADGGSSSLGVAYAILAIDGAVQTAGAILLIYGLASQRDVLIRNDRVNHAMTVRWMPTPMVVGERGHGVGVVGTF